MEEPFLRVYNIENGPRACRLSCFIESWLSVPLSSKKLVNFMRRGRAHTVRKKERETERVRGSGRSRSAEEASSRSWAYL